MCWAHNTEVRGSKPRSATILIKNSVEVSSDRVNSVLIHKQSGAVEACWAHNPEVRGSKPRSARILINNSDDVSSDRG